MRTRTFSSRASLTRPHFRSSANFVGDGSAPFVVDGQPNHVLEKRQLPVGEQRHGFFRWLGAAGARLGAQLILTLPGPREVRAKRAFQLHARTRGNTLDTVPRCGLDTDAL
jgi:hypothetical protein